MGDPLGRSDRASQAAARAPAPARTRGVRESDTRLPSARVEESGQKVSNVRESVVIHTESRG